MRLACFALVGLLSACGGGGGSGGSGGGGQGGNPGGPVSLTKAAQPITASGGATQLIGVHVTNQLQSRDGDLSTVAGQEAASGRLRLNDGSLFFDSSSGFNAAGIASDGANFVAVQNDAFGDSVIYRGREDGTNIFIGIYGKELPASSMPNSNTFTYAGVAELNVLIGSENFDLDTGDASVTANFATNRVDATLDSFLRPSGVPVDEIRLRNMTINGNRFDGGTIRLMLNGSTVTPTGGDTSGAAAGVFLGNLVGGFPDEVGGAFIIRGDDGAVSGAFAAD